MFLVDSSFYLDKKALEGLRNQKYSRWRLADWMNWPFQAFDATKLVVEALKSSKKPLRPRRMTSWCSELWRFSSLLHFTNFSLQFKGSKKLLWHTKQLKKPKNLTETGCFCILVVWRSILKISSVVKTKAVATAKHLSWFAYVCLFPFNLKTLKYFWHW